MSDLFDRLKNRVDANARRAVDAYTKELAEYRSVAADARGRAALLDFAVALRRLTACLAAEGRPLTSDDLEYIASVGRERGEKGVSLASQRSVLVLHSTLMLRDVQEAAGPTDIYDLMHMLDWISSQGLAASHAFTSGFLDGQRRVVPAVMRIQMLADMLLTGDNAAPELAGGLCLPLSGQYVVTVLRTAGPAALSNGMAREEIIEILVKTYQAPMTWPRTEELVALVPSGDPSAEPAQERALSLARAFTELTGLPCAVGTAAGSVPALAEALALARQVSTAAPVEARPSRTHTVADFFVELSAAGHPHVDQWLRDVAKRLAAGPALVTTLDAFYRCDMNRLLAAAALHIHPRTLDYRLSRVRELTGIEPRSTHGVRVLSTTVARMLAGAWTDLITVGSPS